MNVPKDPEQVYIDERGALTEEFKPVYLGQMSEVLRQAYEVRGIQTQVDKDNISVTLNIPRDPELVSLLTVVHKALT